MPRALRDLQAAMAAHLAGDDAGDLLTDLSGDSIPAAARLAVHRHHVRHSLSTALAATFPTVQAVVGVDFFRGIAAAFVDKHLPTGPVLSAYGGGFPAFLAAAPAVTALPYLADVACLDWALSRAALATPGPCLSAADLAPVPATALPGLRLRPVPGLAVVRSDFPIDQIWSASQPEAGAEPVVLGEGVTLLVLRQADSPAFVRISSGEAAFVDAVVTGASLEEAAARAAGADGDFDLSSGFARLLALGSFAALQQLRG